jgi:hypothetical protein
VDTAIDLILHKHLLKTVIVTKVYVIKLKILACDLANAVHGFLTAVDKVINNHELISRLKKFNKAMGADKACSACN